MSDDTMTRVLSQRQQFIQSDAEHFVPLVKSRKSFRWPREIGGLLRQWPEANQDDLRILIKAERFGQARHNLEKITVLRRLDTLRVPKSRRETTLRGVLAFMRDKGRPNAVELVTSPRVMKVLPALKLLGERNMMRYLNAVEATVPSVAITEPGLSR